MISFMGGEVKMLEITLYVFLALLFINDISSNTNREPKQRIHSGWQVTIVVSMIFICLTVLELHK